jgi:hypothetical protein
MTNLHNPVLRVFKALFALIILFCLTLSPVLMQDVNEFEPTDHFEKVHPVNKVLRVKKALSHQKLTPQPIHQFLFYIIPVATIARVIQRSRLHYPSVSLLRLNLILSPIKFTTTFLSRSAA